MRLPKGPQRRYRTSRLLSALRLVAPHFVSSLGFWLQTGSHDEYRLPESLLGWLKKKQRNVFLIVGWQEVNELL